MGSAVRGLFLWLRGGRGEDLPVCGYDGIAFDVDAFGFCFLADAGTGRSVFLFLEGTRHFLEGFGLCNICRNRGLVIMKFGIELGKPR